MRVTPVSAAMVEEGDESIMSKRGGKRIGFMIVLAIDDSIAVMFLTHHIFSFGGCASHLPFTFVNMCCFIIPTSEVIFL